MAPTPVPHSPQQPPLPCFRQMPLLPSPSPQLTYPGFLPSLDAQTTAQLASDVHPSPPCGTGGPAPSASTSAPSPPASSLLTFPCPVFFLHLLSGLTLLFSIPNFFFPVSCYLLQLFHFVLVHGYTSIRLTLYFGGQGCLLWHVGVLVSQPGIEPATPALEAWSLNH